MGGGINGAGIARDAAGRGLSVLLCEQDDLAAHTSSASTKLIHGGLRYLEYREFGLVRKALQEREMLLRAAPHIMWPLRFVMPHMPDLRPAWLIRAGLFLYDHLARARAAARLARHRHAPPSGGRAAGRFDQARFRVLGRLGQRRAPRRAERARRAASTARRFCTRTKLSSAVRARRRMARATQRADGTTLDVRAASIANAAGPWVGELLQGALGRAAPHSVRLVKGSHIVTRRLFEHDHAYIFQNPDKRIIFAIPYEHDYTLIGTTDLEYRGDPSQVAINADETQYLCDSINRYFKQKISPADVRWTYSGVRPLLEEEGADNPSAVTRDYSLELDAPAGEAPLLSVFGGKITTFRKLAEEAVDKLAHALHNGAPVVDGRRAVARRRYSERQLRALSERIQAAACVAAGRSRASLRARLRHARQACDRQCALRGRSRPRLRAGPLRSRTDLPARHRMGAQRAGRAVAPLETRPARRTRHARFDHA